MEIGVSVVLNSRTGVITTYAIVQGIWYGTRTEEVPIEEALERARLLGVPVEYFDWRDRLTFSMNGRDRKGWEEGGV